jgi:hypothetical protein
VERLCINSAARRFLIARKSLDWLSPACATCATPGSAGGAGSPAGHPRWGALSPADEPSRRVPGLTTLPRWLRSGIARPLPFEFFDARWRAAHRAPFEEWDQLSLRNVGQYGSAHDELQSCAQAVDVAEKTKPIKLLDRCVGVPGHVCV